MTKRRDSGTGRYISEETSSEMPENTWTNETDKKAIKTETVTEIYQAIQEVYDREAERITMFEIEQILKKFGLKI